MSKIKSLFEKDKNYILTGIVLLVVCIFLIVTMHTEEDFTLNLPTANLFTMASWLITIVLGIAGIVFLKEIDRKQIDLAKVFLILVIPIGIITSLSRPLGRIPDEVYHARKSMAIAQGNFFSNPNPEKENRATDFFNSKLNELVSLDSKDYKEALRRLTLSETEDVVELEYTTMALYSPICHMPQAISMFVTRILKLPVTVQCYAARFTNFAVSVFLIYMAIKLIPTKKIVVVFVSLLPITIQEIVSLSCDALLISMSIFYISYILYLKYDKTKQSIGKKEIIILAVSSVIISLCKIVYLPICLLLLLLPKEKFKTNKIRIITIVSIICISILLNLIWLVYCSRFLIPFNEGVNSKEQIIYVLQHPINYLLIFFRTINEFNQINVVGLVGEGLGVYDAQSSVIFIYPALVIATMLFIVNDQNDNIVFDKKTKIICLLVFIITTILMYTSVYVQWTSVYSQLIYGIQSRYFLPILLLSSIILNNDKLLYNGSLSKRYILLFMLFLNINTISVILYRYHIGV